MRIGISGKRKWDEQHYQKLRSFGFDCHDFGTADTNAALYSYNDKDFEQYLSREKSLADEAGITIWQVHGPWRWPPLDQTPDDRAERFEKMSRSICAAKLLGAPYWVVHPLMPFGVQEAKTDQALQTKEINLEFMSKLLAVAKQEGVTICLENMPFVDFSLSSSAAIIEVVKEINDPSFAMCLDTGHANVCPAWHQPGEAIRDFAQWIKVMHVHDNKGVRDEHLIPFFGTIDWKDFSAALRETAFDGVLSLECAPSDKLPDDILEDLYVAYYRIAKEISDPRG